MKKKYLYFALILFFILILVGFFRKTATADDIFKDYTIQNITKILISSVNGEIVDLSENEKEYFISLLAESKFKRKIIPNVQKFKREFSIFFLNNNDKSMIFSFELERQILAIRGASGKIEQYYLIDDTKLTEFIEETGNKKAF